MVRPKGDNHPWELIEQNGESSKNFPQRFDNSMTVNKRQDQERSFGPKILIQEKQKQAPLFFTLLNKSLAIVEMDIDPVSRNYPIKILKRGDNIFQFLYR